MVRYSNCSIVHELKYRVDIIEKVAVGGFCLKEDEMEINAGARMLNIFDVRRKKALSLARRLARRVFPTAFSCASTQVEDWRCART